MGRTEMWQLNRDIFALVQNLDKLKKAVPEIDWQRFYDTILELHTTIAKTYDERRSKADAWNSLIKIIER